MKFLKYILIAFFAVSITIANAQSGKDEQLAVQYAAAGEFDKAADLFEKLYSKNQSAFYYNNYLNCLLELKDFKTGEKLVKKLIKKNPSALGYYVDLGNLYNRAQQPDKAKKEFEKAIDLLEPNQQQIIELANTFIAKKEPDYAIKTYLRGKRIVGEYYPFTFELAEVYNLKGDYNSMISEYLDLLETNESFLQQVQNVMQTNVGDNPTDKKNIALKTQLLKRTQQQGEKQVFAEMLIWLYVQERDFENAFNQAKALDKRKKEDGGRIYSLAQLCVSNQDYDIAAKCYQYIISKGNTAYYYTSSKMELVNVLNEKITKSNYTAADLTELENNYNSTLTEIGKSAATAPLMKGLAHLDAYYLNKPDEAEKMLNEVIAMPGVTSRTIAECKLELGDVLLIKGELWEPALLYGQVEKSFKEDPLGHEAKFRNAKLSYYKGEFEWAQAQLDVLKASTSKLIANDALYLSLLIIDNTGMDGITAPLVLFSKADLLFFQHKDDEAFTTLDSINTLYPGHSLADDIIYKKAQIMIQKNKLTDAAAFLNEIVSKYNSDILGDDALFALADLYDNRLNDKTKAMQLYQDLLTGHPGSLYVVEARKRFRLLRGDKL